MYTCKENENPWIWWLKNCQNKEEEVHSWKHLFWIWKVFCIFHVMCIQFEWKLKSAFNSNMIFFYVFECAFMSRQQFPILFKLKIFMKIKCKFYRNRNRIPKLEKSKTFLIIPRNFSLLPIYLSIFYFYKSLMFHELYINNNNKIPLKNK